VKHVKAKTLLVKCLTLDNKIDEQKVTGYLRFPEVLVSAKEYVA
jgi:hypothetical protein